jgi:hypothetical protein
LDFFKHNISPHANKKTKNLISYKKYIIDSKKIDEYKERLFTVMYENIPENIKNSNTASVKSFFLQNNMLYTYDNGHSKIKYDTARNKIILQSYYDEYYHREDLFDYRVVGGKLKFFYILTLYVEGRLA